ncbi:MAG: hypothetical protein JWQ41_2828 [Variovorax sp.]|nr:hypothetical protein [Variovorax sp.]
MGVARERYMKGTYMLKCHAVQLALIAALTLPVAAFAQADPASARVHEPTIDEIYRAAESGRFSDADAMMARVLSAHPQSAKAHFVHAELLAKEGHRAAAKAEYVRADALEPGLPFAKPGVVENLRRTFDGVDGPTVTTPPSRSAAAPVAATSAASSIGMPVKIALALLLAMAAFLIFRRQGNRGAGTAGASTVPQGFATQASPATATTAAYTPTYVTPTATPATAAPAGSGLGGALMSGAAMGLGAVAVQQAVNYFGHREGTAAATPAPVQTSQPAFPNDLGPYTSDDLGGNDFGITDAGSWDDGARDSGNDLNDSDNGW